MPKLAKAVQCLSLNRTGLLLEPGYNCTKMLDWFAEVYTALIGCFLENAHPTCLCEACLPFYLEVQNIYKTIQSWDSNHDGPAKHYVAGHRCTDSLLYGSKLGVLQSAVGFADSLWQSAACECKRIDKPPVMLVWLARPSHYMCRGSLARPSHYMCRSSLARPSHYMHRGSPPMALGWSSMPDECPATLYVFYVFMMKYVCLCVL